MSAELLREAAALMRERAKAATPGPWHDEYSGETKHIVMDVESVHARDHIAQTPYGISDAQHIASWHPAVALAVADWLDAAYDDERRFAAQGAHGFPGENPAFAVARAYLGRDA